MSDWVVVSYDSVDVRMFQDEGTRTAPGRPAYASVISASSDTEAIKQVAGGSGWFAAFELPVLKPVQAVLEVVG